MKDFLFSSVLFSGTGMEQITWVQAQSEDCLYREAVKKRMVFLGTIPKAVDPAPPPRRYIQE